MSDPAREAVLGQLRRSLRRESRASNAARAAVEARVREARPNLIPARADLPLEERIELFRLQAEAVQTMVERITRRDGLPELVAGFLRRHNLPLQLVAAADPWLGRAPWHRAMVEAESGRAAREEDISGLSVAYAGIAETGTCMLLSGRTAPTTVAFLPDNAILVLPSSRVLRAYEDAFQLLRATGRGLPRSVNLVTGPSRTADIEQTLQLGAHGPRRLLVVLVDEPPPGETL